MALDKSINNIIKINQKTDSQLRLLSTS